MPNTHYTLLFIKRTDIKSCPRSPTSGGLLKNSLLIHQVTHSKVSSVGFLDSQIPVVRHDCYNLFNFAYLSVRELE